MSVKPPHNHSQTYWNNKFEKHRDDPKKLAALREVKAKEAAYWSGSTASEKSAKRGHHKGQGQPTTAATGLSSQHHDPAGAHRSKTRSHTELRHMGSGGHATSMRMGSGAPAASTQALFGTANPSAPYSLTQEGPALANNKAAVMQALNQLGATPSEQAVVMAMAMQETTQINVGQRDASKDGRSAANVSAFNLNVDMVAQLGYKVSDLNLNDQRNIGTAVGILVKAMRTWGTKRLLDFQRGGRTGFQDGVSYDCAGYRNAIGASHNLIMADPSLLTDSRRVAIVVPPR
jgi:hypothetical protein